MDNANGGYQDSQTNVRTKKRKHNSRHEPRKRKRSNNKHKRSNPQQIRRLRKKKKQVQNQEHAEANILRLLPEFRLHNFTDKEMTDHQKAALCLGPGFVITRASSKIEQSRAEQLIYTSLNRFIRQIHLRVLFSATPTTIASQFRVANPTFDPTPHVRLEPFISEYIEKLKIRFSNHLTSETFKSSTLSSQHRLPTTITTALKSLKEDSTIRVCLADKNLGFCVVTTDWYIGECLRHLENKDTYELCPSFLVTHNKIIDKSYQDLERIMETFNIRSIEIKNFILQDWDHGKTLKLCSLYILPKIHKPPPLKARPICPNPRTPLFFASRYLHTRLKPFMLAAPTYIKCSRDLIHKLVKLSVPLTCVIVIADVESLYPSIPLTSDTFTRIRKVLEIECLRDEMCMQANEIDFIMYLLEYVLTHNYVEFNDKIYLQISGTAMGTPVAVAFACIFMHSLESEVHQLALDSNYALPLLRVRYIDDYAFIFPTKESYEQYIPLLENVHPNIKLTVTDHLFAPAPFLDLEIFKCEKFWTRETCFLSTRLYRKPQNAYLYLLPWSFHPSHIFPFIKSELSRIRLACSLDSDNIVSRHDFRNYLLKRGYTAPLLDQIFDSHSPTRASILNRPPRLTRARPRLSFVTEYNVYSANLNIKQLLRPGYALCAKSSVEIFGSPNNNSALPFIAYSVQPKLSQTFARLPIQFPLIEQTPRQPYKKQFRLTDSVFMMQRSSGNKVVSNLSHTINTSDSLPPHQLASSPVMYTPTVQANTNTSLPSAMITNTQSDHTPHTEIPSSFFPPAPNTPIPIPSLYGDHSPNRMTTPLKRTAQFTPEHTSPATCTRLR